MQEHELPMINALSTGLKLGMTKRSNAEACEKGLYASSGPRFLSCKVSSSLGWEEHMWSLEGLGEVRANFRELPTKIEVADHTIVLKGDPYIDQHHL